MRHKMTTKRHPADRAKRDKFNTLTEGMKEWKVKLADGSVTTQDYEALRHPQLSGSFRNAIDAFMNDDILDDSGTYDYPF